ncbi:hypothetical protein QO207_27645 [Pseudomonas sp. CAN2814]|uniref:bpX5 domain-containing protein n=1 Tax=Pseudomonas sp. CAN1 TaxID=3046726 RepID=UPI0026498A6E|nr:hypothetical protein [Pseudomonas sp. CAN1]MDN6860381.1 hypothetical protein [Pseudomonas sp. CAN1]
MNGLIQWHWRPRAEAPEPRAAVAWGPAAQVLHQRLQSLPESSWERLMATASGDVLVVFGRPSELPWVEGIGYAAPDDAAPGLWLPTSWEPDVPVDLLGQALAQRFARSPLLLWPSPQAVVPLDRQLPLSAQHLQRIAASWAGR